jgi:hypothetical protein
MQVYLQLCERPPMPMTRTFAAECLQARWLV